VTPVDVLFIHPGDRRQVYQDLGDEFCAVEPPALAGLLATYVRRQGGRTAIIDAPALRLSATEVAEIVTRDFAPTLVVIVVYGAQPSASTQTMTAAGRIAAHVKASNPRLKILMTGTHPAALPARTLAEEAIDFVCDREGPITIWRTAQALAGGASSFADVPSLWWRDGARIVPPRTAEPLVTDLDGELPGIAWDLLPMDRYRAHNWHSFAHIHSRAPYASIHTSLGCPYRCSFCCINAPFGKPSYRTWSPDAVLREIDFLAEHHGVVNLKFVDEMFVLNRQHVLGICDRLAARDYRVNIWAYARVDTVEDDLLDRLKTAGVNWLCLGIESASAHVRDGARKRYDNDDIVDVVRRIQSAGIHVIGNYIFGLPDDTAETMQQTLDLALELNCEFANFYSAMAYPGSPLYAAAVREGLVLPAAWHHYSQHGYECTPLANRHLDAADILAFRDAAWRTYFTAPHYLAMVERTFGADVRDHIDRMVAIPLRRKLLERQLVA
jgi:radical SAM superfamily enzyme YgiQ (UPF0313 family)